MATTSLSTKTSINALLSTYQWGSQNGQGVSITYSFPTASASWLPDYGTEVSSGWSPLTAAQQDNFKGALATWAEVANINFTQVADTQNSVGDIRVAFSNAVKQDGADGWAYYPTSAASPKSGDIWLNPDSTDFSPGSQHYHTMMHEIGHALGLKHSFAAFGSNSTILTGVEDSNQYTIMSYNDYQGAGFVYQQTGPSSYSYYAVQPSTPMLYDIAAIQFLYGANMTTRAGNDTYTFSNSHGELKTIWDAGGIDTFDLSNQTLNQIINLNAGQFSSLGVKQTTFDGALSTATKNIAIAYNAKIENAIGGAGSDAITGNNLDNALTGGAGNDKLTGAAGKDRLNGGLGNDKLTGGAGADTLTGGDGKDIFLLNSTAGVDTITDFSAVSDTIQLENAVFTALTNTGILAADQFTFGGVAKDANDHLIYNQLDGGLYYDTDGAGAIAKTQIALLGVNLALTNADFVVV